MAVRQLPKKGLNPGDSYYLFDSYLNGKRKRKRVVCSRVEVYDLYAEWLDELKGINTPKKSPEMFFENFERYLETFTKSRKKPKQYRMEVSFFHNKLKKLFDDQPVAEMDPSHIEKFINWRLVQKGKKGRVSPATINNEMHILSSFFSWCIRNGLYNKLNPCYHQRLSCNNERRIRLTPDEILEIIEKSKNYGGLHTVVMLALFSGMRMGEIDSIEWKDVDLPNRRIEVRAENSKNNKHRSIPIPDPLFEHLVTLRRNANRVISIGYDCIRFRFTKLRKDFSFSENLTVDTLRFHDLRHVYAQMLRDASVSLDEISSYLGHSDPKITKDRYAQAGGYDGVNTVNRLNSYLYRAK